MDDGKPTGAKATWWSQPGPGRGARPAPSPDQPSAVPGQGAESVSGTGPEDRAPAADPADPADPVAPAEPVGLVDSPASSDAVESTGPIVSAGSADSAHPAGSVGAVSGSPAAQGGLSAGEPGAGVGVGEHAPRDMVPPVPTVAPTMPDVPPGPPVPVAPPLSPPPAPTVAPATPGPAPETAASAPLLAGPPPAMPPHAPEAHHTPPYGQPGPWAPAPLVERPGAPGGAVPSVPPQPSPYDGQGELTHGHHASHGHPGHQGHDGRGGHEEHVGQTVPGVPAAPGAGSGQWGRYDPWAAPGAAPLTRPDEPVRRKSRRGAAVVGAVLLALVAGGIGGGVGAYIERNGGLDRIELDQAPKDGGGRAPDSVAGIAARALPSVVTLHVSGGAEQGTGTGFVLDRRGHILTNNHVVAPAGAKGDITVTFSGGETARGTLVGKDSGYDLAVVKVTGVSGLTPLPLGNSDSVRVGDPVVAIGAPFDLQNTVTSGIISAKERPITAGGEKGDGSDVSYVDALQTDAPINPGNSGGPLVDTRARVIGINSAIRAADTGASGEGAQSGSIGLGFAIPINQGKRVAEELINTGKATHPVIGVSLDMQYKGDGARVGEKGRDGSASVIPDGPSAKAGIRPGDVITKVNGQRVHSGEELIVKIRAHRPGDRLELTLVRGGQERTLTLTLGSAAGSS
ncbi:trypsin-like peptidase domain-containing protein [Streptomyces sp. NPDC057638]|uniref:trypsin-like peptidase domain-containing protein n=1 Tax=Streptomyces sp. NPDC057638 TaxID=3346190 RepID=UPI003693ACC4